MRAELVEKAVAEAPRENMLTSLLFNVALPMFVLTKLTDKIGALEAWILGLGLPLGYFIYDYLKRRSISYIAVLGFFSILCKGALGFLKADIFWFAVNEAFVPLIFAILLIATQWSKTPLINTLLLNDQFMDMDKVRHKLEETGNIRNFENLIRSCTYILLSSFLLSSALNFTLAMVMLKSPPGSDAFNEEMGKMIGVSYVVILVPSMVLVGVAMWLLLRGLKKMTGLDLDSILKNQRPAPTK